MRVLVQRVTMARVDVDGETVGVIGAGYLLLVGVAHVDETGDADRLAGKVARLRLFPNEAGKFDRSLLDVGGGALVVSQFTLMGDASRGRRPDVTKAARPEHARPLVDRFAAGLREAGVIDVQTGRFGAAMAVTLTNDGPVTLALDSRA